MLSQRKKIWYLWAIVSLIVFIVLLLLTLTNRFEGQRLYIWGVWFGTIIVSNLLIIISTFVFEEKAGIRDRKPISSFLFRLAWGFSFIFLMLPLIAVFSWPLTNIVNPIVTFKQIGVIAYTVEPIMAITLSLLFYGDNLKALFGSSGDSDVVEG